MESVQESSCPTSAARGDELFIKQSMSWISDEFPQCLLAHEEGQEFKTIDKPTNAITASKPCRFVLIQNFPEGFEHIAVIVRQFGDEYAILPREIQNFVARIKSGVKVVAGHVHDDPIGATSEQLRLTGTTLVYTDVMVVNEETVRAHFLTHGLRLLVRDDGYRRRKWEGMEPEILICHDSRDKTAFVNELYAALATRRIKVWYDQVDLEVGDSLVAKIDDALKKCRFAAIVISKNFVERRPWTSREFRSLVTRELASKAKVILPIWLDITTEDVRAYSLELADKVAIRASEGVNQVADKLARLVKQSRK